ncbi:unnamed protein product [Larinioides sclopetarius]|uniref:Uncharacterized protein n=1 Tax=Larinioides sclopetarius TaxID=280406 RepID=A0AAV1YTY3_9ARAC
MRRHDGDSEQIRFRVVRWLVRPSNRDLRKLKECVHLRIAYHQMLCSTSVEDSFVKLRKISLKMGTLERNECTARNHDANFSSKQDVNERTSSHQGGNE